MNLKNNYFGAAVLRLLALSRLASDLQSCYVFARSSIDLGHDC